MTEPYTGEIQLFGFDFNPVGWALCNGATLPIVQNTALYSLLGVAYGGNGSSTFQLPNFCARAGSQQGQGGGLSNRQRGDTFGTAGVSLLSNQIPPHQHGINAFSQADSTKKTGTPANGAALSTMSSSTARPFVTVTQPDTQFSPTALLPTGNGVAHENQQPYLAVNFCIALYGDYPDFG
ncbi:MULTISPECIES: phage tail protein [Xanthomonas]|jgi:microcystin-dependent protein|uniref:Phage tail collar domain-containing protein n=1 Tax=Xanthomonas arboricola TaxID=56448 RepID=A0AAU9IN64_9XANT|nr:tail fiber protein [Xanthomonas arboricola]KER88075.1 microcystin-dependent protein [Xanthomonas arboricola pv. celebensis]MBB4707729.1 microcystin-dependent protein [Xanthomonas arboricola]MBB6257826.1 microcystin-dependent protein [Xanthomonas arboricola]MBB6571908.1 microcystin-dependent protein [Xanthomonas arboricola]NJB79048.1 microcystin-dependent protein [Xanthomonas arboricola]